MTTHNAALEKMKPFKVTNDDVKSGAAKFKLDIPLERWTEANRFIKDAKIATSPPQFTENGVRVYFTTQHAKNRLADFVKSVK